MVVVPVVVVPVVVVAPGVVSVVVVSVVVVPLDVPVVVPGTAGPIAPAGTAGVPAGKSRRFGYDVGLEQHALGSAYCPDCGAWSNVTAIIPPSLYAGDFLICGTTVFRNSLAPVSPGFAFGLHAASLPSEHGAGMM